MPTTSKRKPCESPEFKPSSKKPAMSQLVPNDDANLVPPGMVSCETTSDARKLSNLKQSNLIKYYVPLRDSTPPSTPSYKDRLAPTNRTTSFDFAAPFEEMEKRVRTGEASSADDYDFVLSDRFDRLFKKHHAMMQCQPTVFQVMFRDFAELVVDMFAYLDYKQNSANNAINAHSEKLANEKKIEIENLTISQERNKNRDRLREDEKKLTILNVKSNSHEPTSKRVDARKIKADLVNFLSDHDVDQVIIDEITKGSVSIAPIGNKVKDDNTVPVKITTNSKEQRNKLRTALKKPAIKTANHSSPEIYPLIKQIREKAMKELNTDMVLVSTSNTGNSINILTKVNGKWTIQDSSSYIPLTPANLANKKIPRSQDKPFKKLNIAITPTVPPTKNTSNASDNQQQPVDTIDTNTNTLLPTATPSPTLPVNTANNTH